MTIVYRYGIAAPHENAELVLDQMRLAHAYERDLVLIERGRRAAERTARSESSEGLLQLEFDVAAAEARCETLAGEIRTARKRSRSRSETGAQRDELRAAREEAKQHRGALREKRRSLQAQCAACREAKNEEIPCAHATPEARALRIVLDGIEERAGELRRSARAHSGLYWGTYLLVEAACRASFGAPLYEADGITPHDPRMPPRTWDGTGTVGVQIQSTRPLDVASALRGEDARVQITAPAWPEAWLSARPLAAPGSPSAPPPGYLPDGVTPAPATRPDGTPARWVRDRAQREGTLRLRVGQDGEMAAWRLDYHRPMPPAALSWVTFHRRMRGPHPEWSVCFTIEMQGQETGARTHADAVVAIDVGWRQMPDGSLRVAAWADSEGCSGELRLTPSDLRALRQPAEIQSERDALYDFAKMRLKRWIDAAADALEWMRAVSPHLHSWRSPARLVALLHRWHAERPAVTGPEAIVRAGIDAWADRDRHEWATVEARRMWSLRRRKDKYRVFSADLARRYTTIVLEKFDLREIAERKPTGEDKAENEIARSNRQLAAVSELRGALQNACGRHGAMLVTVSAVDSTRTCPSCGLVADRDAAAQVRLTCECGHAWDQDTEGAAPTLLARYRERPRDAKTLVGAREDEKVADPKKKGAARWARARRMGAAKRARIEGARKAAGNDAE